MKPNGFPRVLVAVLLAAPCAVSAATFSTRLAGAQNWNTVNLWSTAGCGGAVNGALPGAGDTVTICAGHNVTMNIPPSIQTIDIIGTLSAGANTLTLGGTVGTLFTRSGTFNAGTSTVIMNPDAAVTLTSGAIAFNNLQLAPILAATNRTYTFGAGAITINGDFTINPTDSTGASNRLTVNMGAAITVAPGFTTTIRGSGTSPGLATLNTASFALTSGRLVVGTTAVDGTFVANNSTVTLNAASGTLFTRVGTFTQGTSTIVLSPTAPVTLNSGTITFNNLTTNMPGQTATLGNDITVGAVLNFGAANGYLVTGTNAVIIGSAGSISGPGAGGHVVGNLTRQFVASTTFLFTVGDGANYAPVNVVFTANATGNLTVSGSSPADHPNTVAGTSPADPNRSVNRFWTVKGSTIAGTATLTFNYLAGSPRDLDTGVTVGAFVLGRGGAGTCAGTGTARLCTTWSRPTLAGPPTTTIAAASGIVFTNAPVQESDFVIGEVRRAAREREFIYARETY
jgi:fibronectin-binding autotransporter adhesin